MWEVVQGTASLWQDFAGLLLSKLAVVSKNSPLDSPLEVPCMAVLIGKRRGRGERRGNILCLSWSTF